MIAISRSILVLLFTGALTSACSPWVQTTPATSPTSRNFTAMAPIGTNQVLLFGGQSETETFDDTWLYDCATDVWTSLCTFVVPPARREHAMVRIGPDRVLLSEGTWIGASPLQPKPPPRAGHGMASLGPGLAVLFGGGDAVGAGLDDTWIFDLTGGSGVWTEVTPGVGPSARGQHGMTGLGDGTALLFGGFATGAPGMLLGDTWRFDGGTMQWTEVTSSVVSPAPRYGHALALRDTGRPMLFGGRIADTPGGEDDETWHFNSATGQWGQLVISVQPSARFGFGLGSCEAPTEAVALFGGFDGAFDGETWEHQTLAPPPSRATANGGNIATNARLQRFVRHGRRLALRHARELAALATEHPELAREAGAVVGAVGPRSRGAAASTRRSAIGWADSRAASRRSAAAAWPATCAGCVVTCPSAGVGGCEHAACPPIDDAVESAPSACALPASRESRHRSDIDRGVEA